MLLLSQHAAAVQLHPDKDQLRQLIIMLHGVGMSYREIGAALGIHWTRVGQVLKSRKHGWMD